MEHYQPPFFITNQMLVAEISEKTDVSAATMSSKQKSSLESALITMRLPDKSTSRNQSYIKKTSIPNASSFFQTKSKPTLGLLNSFCTSDSRLFLHASLHNAMNKVLLCKRINDQHGHQCKENLCRVRRDGCDAVAERV